MDLKQLTDLHGPSGNERAVRRAIIEAVKPLADEVKIDRSGNVICLKKGTKPDKPAVMVAAHMDEVGFIIAGYTEDGLLRFRPIGGIDPRVIVSKWVVIGDDKVPGVIGAMAIHLQTADDRKRVLRYNNLYIDIGAKDQKEAEKLCPLGAYAAFDTPYAEFGDGFVCAKALDDRVGCYNMLRLLENRYPATCTAALSPRRRLACAVPGARLYHVPAGIALVLEVPRRPGRRGRSTTSPVPAGRGRELYGPSQHRRPGAVPPGAGSGRGRRHPPPDQAGVTGGNDAGSLQVGGEGRRTVVFSVPCRYIHLGRFGGQAVGHRRPAGPHARILE